MPAVPKADLHLHTTASDGKSSPEAIVKKAADAGLKTISITDHDTCSGYIRARAAAAEHGINIISGIEITCEYNGRECHLLGYNFDSGKEEMKTFVRAQQLRRHKRARKMIENLNRLGFDISIDEVTAESGTLNISRNHLAAVMVSKGYAPHKRQVFHKYLGDHASAYHKTDYESVDFAISLIQECGGVAVLAHPGLFYVDEDIKYLIGAGIDGMECIHPSHNYALQKRYIAICESSKLLKTGGSDFHGYENSKSSYFGTVCIEHGWVDTLLNVSA